MTDPYSDLTLPEKKALAKQWKVEGWKRDAIADELSRCEATIERWTNPKYAASVVQRRAVWGRQNPDKAKAIQVRCRTKRSAWLKANPEEAAAFNARRREKRAAK